MNSEVPGIGTGYHEANWDGAVSGRCVVWLSLNSLLPFRAYASVLVDLLSKSFSSIK